MTYRLTDLLVSVLDDGLGQMTAIRATSGSTTTIGDTNANGAYGDDADALLNGTAFVIHDAAGAGAAPEGEFQRISDFDGELITVDTAFSSAVGTGDIVGVAQAAFPIQKCILSANNALQSLGTIPIVDITSIVPDGVSLEYTLPIAWKFARPFRIDIRQSATMPWIEISNYEITPSLPGATSKITFTKYLPKGWTARVWYMGLHPEVRLFSDPIQESIHPALAEAALTEVLAGWYVKQAGGKDAFWREIWNKSAQELQHAKEIYPIDKPLTKPVTLNIGNRSRWDDPTRGSKWQV